MTNVTSVTTWGKSLCPRVGPLHRPLVCVHFVANDEYSSSSSWNEPKCHSVVRFDMCCLLSNCLQCCSALMQNTFILLNFKNTNDQPIPTFKIMKKKRKARRCRMCVYLSLDKIFSSFIGSVCACIIYKSTLMVDVPLQ